MVINAEIKSYCERLLHLEQERKALAADIADIKKEAAGKGYDKALINKTVSLMLKDADKRQKALEQHELFDTYLIAAGLLAETETAPNVGGPTGEALEMSLKHSASPVQLIQDTQPLIPVAEASAAGAAPPDEPAAPIATAADDEPAGQRGGDGPASPPDLYAEAVRCVRGARSPNTVFLQNALRVTYQVAAEFIERMEREGVISAPLASGKRAMLDDDLGNIPAHLDRRKPKPEYSATDLLSAG
jgi:uncharacterized protein (UPF0335 family)